jgi:hypothetical protein
VRNVAINKSEIMINLRRLEIDSGEEGARYKFERLIGRLVKLKYPTAQEIRPNPGDWGIDVFVGKLTSGNCLVWQAKYFPKGINDSQKNQVESSFSQIVGKSKEKGFKVKAWDLCIPSTLSGPENIWWEKWVKQKNKETGITVKLMSSLDITSLLQTADAAAICTEFNLKDNFQVMKEEKPIVPLPLEIASEYEHSLFILKLLAAGIQENMSARNQFFNAEIVSKEIHDKKDELEIAELNSLYEKIHSMWEARFVGALQSNNPTFETRKVYSDMLKSIEQDKELLYCHRLPISFFHKQGLMQQMANICRIGWTPDFRNIDKRS